MEKNSEMVRVNSRISSDLNDWLNDESESTGLSKSSIMMLAAENYRTQKRAFNMMADMGDVVNKLEELNQTIKRNGLE